MKKICLFISLVMVCLVQAQTYTARIVDEQGKPIGYATVYLMQNPAIGTASNNNGVFHLQTGAHPSSQVIISFLGYEKREVTLKEFAVETDDTLFDIPSIVLKEQPIALEETVVSAKASKQKNRRKQMKELLYKVYNQMLYDFSDTPYQSELVSDVRMDSEGEPWGMEQMIATVINIPREEHQSDSTQFQGKLCKRFFDNDIRSRADRIYQDAQLQGNMRRAASAVDSGVVVHEGLWKIGNIRLDFEKTMSDVKHWQVTQENEGETVLTHTEKHNYLGMFKMEIKRHYIVDSNTYSVHRFSEEGTADVSIPFGYKVKGMYLDMLNLLNMNNERIERFRIRRAHAYVRMNTIYERDNGKLYIIEKNMVANAVINSVKSQHQTIPIDIKATQRVTNRQTENVQLMNKQQITRRLRREIVEVY